MNKKLVPTIKAFSLVFILWCGIIKTAIRNHEKLSDMVTISDGNIKTGKIKSFSLLPFFTCHKRCLNTCGEKCYAKKICILRPSVLTSYARNTALAKLATKTVFNVIDKSVKNCCFFRFHVSGDIINEKYFSYMVKTALKNPHCTFLAFTKQYEIVNTWIDKNGTLPKNLKILFSGWTNLSPINPYNLPETQVYKTETEKNPSWKDCGGNCLNCAMHDTGCWTAKNGETICFKMH